jgi:hypothetical protein
VRLLNTRSGAASLTHAECRLSLPKTGIGPPPVSQMDERGHLPGRCSECFFRLILELRERCSHLARRLERHLCFGFGEYIWSDSSPKLPSFMKVSSIRGWNVTMTLLERFIDVFAASFAVIGLESCNCRIFALSCRCCCKSALSCRCCCKSKRTIREDLALEQLVYCPGDDSMLSLDSSIKKF